MKENTATVQAHYLPSALRALIIASAFWALSLSLTILSGSVAAIAGSLIACLAVDRWANAEPIKQVRTSTIVAAAAALLLLNYAAVGLVTRSDFLASMLSPIVAFELGEALNWFGLCLAATTVLRSLAQRTSFGGVLEILFVATAFVVTLSAHRNGMIHRPFFIGDYALIRGIDPATILMAFGCLAVIALSALLMAENNQRRLPYHFAILGLLCFSLAGFVRFFGLPTPGMTDDLGLTGQEIAGNSQQKENPFRDGENTAEDKEAPVAVVVFRDDYEPLNGSYYFRESAYSQFNGVMLDYTSRGDMDRDLIESFTNTELTAEVLPQAMDQRKTVRTTVGMLVPHRNPFGLVSPATYINAANPNNLRFKRTYDTLSYAPTYDFEYMLGRELGRDDWSDELRNKYLELPSDPRYRELAESLIANLRPEYADDPFAKAWAIKTYLDENGIYSLKNDHAYETDPAASFLFGDLTGYCMHFSFAATYMFRSIGIPARVGIGYSVPASNRAGGSALLVQAVHGHAWPEIYFKDIGWVIVDPAPQQTLVDMSTDPQNELQQLLGDMLRDDASFADFMEQQQSGLIDLQTLLNIVYGLLVAAMVLGYSIRSYRYFAPSVYGPEQQYRLAYRAALDQLAGVGVIRHYGESRERFAVRAAATSPTIEPATATHLARSLGASDGDSTTTDWKTIRRAIAKEIGQNTPRWRRALAFCNPYSWLFTR